MRVKEYESLAESLRKRRAADEEDYNNSKQSTVGSTPVQSTSSNTTNTGELGDQSKLELPVDADSNNKTEPNMYDWRESALSARLKPIEGVDNSIWESRKSELADIYKQAKKQKQYGELAETIGQALIQLGAGYSGLKTGTDMSGLKFNRSNWEKQYDQLLDELRTGLQDTEQSRGAVERAHEMSVRDQEKEQSRLDTAAADARRRKFDMTLARIRDKQSSDELKSRTEERTKDKQEAALGKQQERLNKQQQDRDQLIEQAKTELFNAADTDGKTRDNHLAKYKDNIVRAGGTAEQAQEWLDENMHWYSDDYDAMISSINNWKQSLPNITDVTTNTNNTMKTLSMELWKETLKQMNNDTEAATAYLAKQGYKPPQ
jgi:hypothetical protein